MIFVKCAIIRQRKKGRKSRKKTIAYISGITGQLFFKLGMCTASFAKHDKLQLLNFHKTNPAPVMLKYNLQPVVTSFISIALIMNIMMTIGVSRS